MPFWIAFLLALGAGLATSVGGALAFLTHRRPRMFAASLGFSAGVMLYVSFVEILPKGIAALSESFDEVTATWWGIGGFFAGVIVVAIIDRLVPDEVNPHEPANRREGRLLRMGLFTGGVIALHNFPEGFATLMAALQSPEIALPVVFAIAVHNIPEGIAVAVPIYHATQSKRKAFSVATMSGLAEPVGALLGYAILRPWISDTLFGFVFAGVAGIMVFISLDELLPAAEEYGEHHVAIYALIAGMGVMALSLLLFL